MNKRWIAITGGLLVIILGIFELITSFIFMIFFLLVIFGMWVYYDFSFSIVMSVGGLNILLSIFVTLIILLMLSGILGAVGGFFAIRREKWKFVLSGSVLAGIIVILSGVFFVDTFHMSPGYMSLFCLLGIASPMLVIISKKQFKISTK